MLYLVATPIGNLADMTYRAVETLKTVDYILCEDTRHSRVLLTHYAIQKPLKSYHKFNEAKVENTVLSDLHKGLKVALISDAGTPGISDPGTRLVEACLKEHIQVEALPGACSVIQALVCSGFETTRFQFLGFSPKQKTALNTFLNEAITYPGTTIFYESPHRILACLKQLCSINPNVQVATGRELTKKFEEWQRGTAREVLEQTASSTLKGEYVVLLSGLPPEAPPFEGPDSLPHLMEEVQHLMRTQGLSQQQAMKHVAKSRGISKRVLYQWAHHTSKPQDC